MLGIGIFGDKYIDRLRRGVSGGWSVRAKLAEKHHDRELNYFGVDANQPLSVRRKRLDLPGRSARLVPWYCRYYVGRRLAVRARRIRRWRAIRATCGESSGMRTGRIAVPAAAARRCCNGPMTAGSFNGTEMGLFAFELIVSRCIVPDIRQPVFGPSTFSFAFNGFWAGLVGLSSIGGARSMWALERTLA